MTHPMQFISNPQALYPCWTLSQTHSNHPFVSLWLSQVPDPLTVVQFIHDSQMYKYPIVRYNNLVQYCTISVYILFSSYYQNIHYKPNYRRISLELITQISSISSLSKLSITLYIFFNRRIFTGIFFIAAHTVPESNPALAHHLHNLVRGDISSNYGSIQTSVSCCS